MASLFDEQDLIEGQAKSVKMKIDRLSVYEQEVETRLDLVKELLASKQTGENQEIPEFRKKLRNKIRQLIQRIDVYPVGLYLMTVPRVKKQINAILDVQPELAGTEQIKHIERDLLDQIENRDNACFTVHFEGGSFRHLSLYKKPELSLDFNKDERKLINRFIGIDGEEEVLEFEEY